MTSFGAIGDLGEEEDHPELDVPTPPDPAVIEIGGSAGSTTIQNTSITSGKAAIRIHNVEAHLPTNEYTFLSLSGVSGAVISDCTIFGPDPKLRVLVRSWARRWWWRQREGRNAVKTVTMCTGAGALLGIGASAVGHGWRWLTR